MNKKNLIMIIHFFAWIGFTTYITFHIEQLPLYVRLIFLGISMFVFLATYLVISTRTEEPLFSSAAYWYMCFIYSAVFMHIFTSDILMSGIYNAIKYFIVVGVIFCFAIIFLRIAKTKFSNVVFIINVMLVSTYVIMNLSNVFSFYYYIAYDIDIPMNYGKNIIYRILSYGKFSLRYFFEFPPEEYYDLVTFIQFITGRIYEAVLLGGVVSVITDFLGKEKKKD